MSKNIYELWEPTIERITSQVARDFPDVEAEDLSQDLWVVVLEHKWQDPDNNSITTILRRAARSSAMRYRTQQLGQTAQYSYRTTEIRKILENVFEHDNWPRRSVPTYGHAAGGETPQWGLMTDDSYDQQGVSPGGEFNQQPRIEVHGDVAVKVSGVSGPSIDWDDTITSYVDIKRAWTYLPVQYKRAIFVKYALGEDPQNLADRRRLERAVIRLTDIINWYRF